MNKVQHVKWCMKQAKLTSEISCTTDSCLAQLVRHWPEDLEDFQSPMGGIFDNSLCKDLSGNLTEMPMVKNSIIIFKHMQKRSCKSLSNLCSSGKFEIEYSVFAELNFCPRCWTL